MSSRAQTACLVALVLGDVLLAVVSAWTLPASVPVHWNFRGEVDRYGSPWELAFILPAVVVLFTGLLMALPSIGSIGAALQRSRSAYGRIAIACVGALVGIHAIVVVFGPNHPANVVPAIMVGAGLLLMLVGNWMGKIRRNAIVGIRAPWTLKSDAVWERTHRIGGRLQVAHGLAVVLAAILFPVWAAVLVLIGGLLALVVWALAYSWTLDRATL